MKLWKSSVLIISIAVLLLATVTVSAESDTTDDVLYWKGSDWYNWQWNVGNRPNIDIVDVSYNAEDRLTISMTVNGEINSEKSWYHLWYNTSNAWYHLHYYPDEESEPVASALPLDFESWSYEDLLNWTEPETETSVSASTITATFDWVTEDHTMTGFYAWSQEWENISDQYTEFWIDYAPNDYSPYGEFEDYEPEDGDGEDTEGDGDGTNGNGSEGNGDTSNGTPGFEVLVLLVAIGAIFIILRRRK